VNTQTAQQTKANSPRPGGLARCGGAETAIRIGQLAITVESRGSYLAANAAVAATPVVLAAVSVGGGLASTLLPSHAVTSPLATPALGAAGAARITAMREPAVPGSARFRLGPPVRGVDELKQRSTALSLALGQGRSESGSSALDRRAPARASGTVGGGAAGRKAAPARAGRVSNPSTVTPRPTGSVDVETGSALVAATPRVVPASPIEMDRLSGGSDKTVTAPPVLDELGGTRVFGTYDGRRHGWSGRRWHSQWSSGSDGDGDGDVAGSSGDRDDSTSPAPPDATTTITEPDPTQTTTGPQTATSPPPSGDAGVTSDATTTGTDVPAAATDTTSTETPPTTEPEATPTTTETQAAAFPPAGGGAGASDSTTSTGPTTSEATTTTSTTTTTSDTTTDTTTDTPATTATSTPSPAAQSPSPSTGAQDASAVATPNGSAQIYVATDGNDATCARDNPNAPCATLDGADAVAQPGDTIQVAPGNYPDVAKDGYGAGIFHDTQATYVCAPGAAAESVTFDSPGFLVGPGGGNVTIEGSCFSFHVVHVGLDGYNSSSCANCQVENVTFDDVSMDSFEITGAENVTIADSTVGPLVTCYADGDGSGAPSYADCPDGSYWSSQGGTAGGGQDEPFIHNNGPDIATDVTLQGDTIEGISSLWDGTHTGGLLFWSTANLHILDTTFTHDAIYDILENQDSTDTGLEIEGNTFDNPVYSQDPTDNSGAPLVAPGWQEVELGSSGDTLTDATVSGNTFTNGIRFGDSSNSATYDDVSVADNTLGSDTTCGPLAGITFAGNDSCNG
jgi:hypothetical protein